MIKYLPWDTSFFGYKVGETLESPDLDEAKEEGYKLLYVRSKTPQKMDAFVDHRVRFYKNISPVSVKDDHLISLLGKPLTPELIHISEVSGGHSRYKLDKNFKSQEFERLYREWIRKSLTGEIADDVIAYMNSGEVAGLVTVKLKETEAHIGLIAVTEKVQGKGVGSVLINAVEDFAFKHGARTLHVPTQKNNEGSCRFYSKNGFSIEYEEFIYQIWI